MDINALGIVYEAVRSRIKTHRTLYEQNEMAVRDQLVEPVLRALGWNTEDPDWVVPNLSMQEGFPDYALLTHGKPVLFVEAKNLREDVEDVKWISQLLKYAFNAGTAYGLLTNGAIWILAASFKIGTSPTERIIWKMDFENDALKTVGRKLSMLSPNNVASLDSVIEKTRLMDEAWNAIVEDPTYFVLGFVPIMMELLKQSYPNVSILSDDIEDYLNEKFETVLSLSTRVVVPEDESLPSDSTTAKPQVLVLFGEEHPIRNAYDILVHTANWLVRQGKLTRADVPIKAGPKRYLVNDRKQHVYGNEFVTPKQLDNGLWIEVHYSRIDCIRYAKRLLERYGYSADKLIIR